ncbi:MAG: hypothetical protein J0H15_07865 [Xanthomonadales bacterium]|nr:hypothetical protein [Xanthomonadales bacterium]
MMRMVLGAILLLSFLSGCATTYQKSGFSGGFSELQLKGDIWRIRFAGNGYASYETVQTYWLNRCAELALQQGYDGFEILSDLRLTMHVSPEHMAAGADGARAEQAQMIFIPMDTGPKPAIEADIKLLHGEITSMPPRLFNARKLKEALAPHVSDKKCAMGNVCPHPHDYIYGKGEAGL